jgi:hypothetical protein
MVALKMAVDGTSIRLNVFSVMEKAWERGVAHPDIQTERCHEI